MVDVVELLEHWHAGRPKTVIAESLGVNRETVGKYVAPAIAAGITRGGPRLSRAEWAVLVEGWFAKLIDPQARSLTRVGVRILRRGPGPLGPRICSAEHIRNSVPGRVMWRAAIRALFLGGARWLVGHITLGRSTAWPSSSL